MKKKLGERVRLARMAKRLGQRELAELVGVSHLTISRLERGLVYPRAERIDRLARVLERPVTYFTGQQPEIETVELEAIPVLDQLGSLGSGALVQDYVYLGKRRPVGENIMAIVARGDCLVPEIQSGDIVIFDSDASAREGDVVVATRDNELLVKRFRDKQGDQWLEANDTTIPLADVQIRGVVLGFYRSKR